MELLEGSSQETVTRGLDSLPQSCQDYVRYIANALPDLGCRQASALVSVIPRLRPPFNERTHLSQPSLFLAEAAAGADGRRCKAEGSRRQAGKSAEGTRQGQKEKGIRQGQVVQGERSKKTAEGRSEG